MGFFRFRQTFKIAPGIRFNLSKSGPSVSFGPRGLHYTIGLKGTRATVGLPGSGVSSPPLTTFCKSASDSAIELVAEENEAITGNSRGASRSGQSPLKRFVIAADRSKD